MLFDVRSLYRGSQYLCNSVPSECHWCSHKRPRHLGQTSDFPNAAKSTP